MLLYLNNRKAGKLEMDVIKASLVASGNWSAQSLFPDIFPEEGEQSGGGEDVTYDYGAVKWESPESSGFDEYERLQRMMRQSGVSLSEEDEIDSPAAFFEAGDAAESAEWI
jgi:hypothetical protein